MKHYPHHIGDFDRATRHLTRIERSVYRDMIELYYDLEKPLPLDVAWIRRKVLAHTDEEATAVEQALNEFFIEIPNGWWHERCEEELDKYRANNSQRAQAGKASAAKRASKKHQALNGDSTVVATFVEREPNDAPTNQSTNQPINQSTKGGESAPDAVPVDNFKPPPISDEFREVLKSRPDIPDPGATWDNFQAHYPQSEQTMARWRKWVATEHAPPADVARTTTPAPPGPDPTLAKLDREAPLLKTMPPEFRAKLADLKRAATAH